MFWLYVHIWHQLLTKFRIKKILRAFFLCSFSDKIRAYGQKRMCLHCIRVSSDFCADSWVTDRSKSVGYCAISVQRLRSLRVLPTETEPVRLPCSGWTKNNTRIMKNGGIKPKYIPIWKMFCQFQGPLIAMRRLLWWCWEKTARYSCDFTWTAPSSNCNRSIFV